MEALPLKLKMEIVKNFSKILKTFSVKFLLSISRTLYLEYRRVMKTPQIYVFFYEEQLSKYFKGVEELTANDGFLIHWIKIKFYDELLPFHTNDKLSI